MSLSSCHVILSDCCAGERLAYDEYLLDDDIVVLDLRLELLHDHTLLRLRAVYPLPAVEFIMVRVYLSKLLCVCPGAYCGMPDLLWAV